MKISFLISITTAIILFACTNPCYANISLISPTNNSILSSRNVTFKIQNNSEEEYSYKFVFQKYPESLENVSFYKETKDLLFTTNVPKDKEVYIWYVEYHPKNTFTGTYDFRTETFVFGVNKEIPSSEENNTEETMKEADASIHTEQKQDIVVKQKDVFQKDEGIDWNVNTDTPKILGRSSKSEKINCFFKYNESSKTSTFLSCDIPQVDIRKVESYPFTDLYSTIVEGKLTERIYIQIDEYACKREIFDPSSWFSCQEKLNKSEIIEMSPHITMSVYDGIQKIPIRGYNQNGDSFDLVAGHSKEYKDLKLTVRYRIVNSKYKIFEDIPQEYTLNSTTSSFAGNTKKPFSFPFTDIFGVTQWYGNTAYQKPHTGIDFGVKKEKILAVGDGEIVSVGTDREGECNSGGKYLLVKQSNGMYTGYFHLKKIATKIGSVVKKGDVLGVSGNSGMWNCQPLGYHLHFTVRKKRESSSHVNPVKYIDVDWNLVPTLGYKSYPGRLSGENPHPGS